MNKEYFSLEMCETRRRLEASAWGRRRAVCEFPLAVASMCSEMRKAIRYAEAFGMHKEVEELLQFYESRIKQEYRKHFGTELGQ